MNKRIRNPNLASGGGGGGGSTQFSTTEEQGEQPPILFSLFSGIGWMGMELEKGKNL